MTRRLTGQPGSGSPPVASPECHDDVCITCGDQAEPRVLLELRAGGLALVETAAGREEISVALVAARVGDVILVHAKEAIAVIRPDDGRSAT